MPDSSDNQTPKKKNKRVCVFCGKLHADKNREHVLPRWLIELTGDLKRTVWLGYDHANHRDRVFAYSSLTVPACTTCNTKYSDMEARVKTVIQAVLSESAVSRNQFDLLLDWFDKVRIGMWILYYNLDKNLAGIEPFYYVDHRIRSHDRIIIISKSSDIVTNLTYRGCNTPSFYYTPSCFSLMVNQYCFTNISSPYFIAKNLGLPWAAHSAVIPGGAAVYSMVPGSEAVTSPVLSEPFRLPSTRIYQPVWRNFIGTSAQELYETDYARGIALDHGSGVGGIFLEKGEDVRLLTAEATTEWIPLVRTRHHHNQVLAKQIND
jgi:hypothetical protein